MSKLRLIQPSPAGPREAARQKIKASKPADLVQCNRCGGREFVETKTGVMYRDGKYIGGTKSRICVACLLIGHRQTS